MLALAPGVGDVDIVLASELMEAGRTIAGGFVTPDRTLVIASTARSYLVVERMAMADGRYDSARLIKAIEEHSQARLLLDMETLAKQSGAMINAVMLGIIAGCGRLPIPATVLEGAIRADGKAVDANLAGFRSGLEAVQTANVAAGEDAPRDARRLPASSLADLERAIVTDMPAPARDVILEGVRRLVAYQDVAYARLYLDRLAPIRAADERVQSGGRLLREIARHLAVRMSYEDVIRVAQAKIDPARLARIAAEMGVKPGEPFTVTEFLKPGIEEMCSLLPPRLAERILALAERRGWIDRVHWGMEVNSASVSGFLRFWMLAKLRGWRPKSYRFQEEQRAIEAWLGLIVEAARTLGRSCARGRGMRAPDQGLWRHPQTRYRQLPPDRGPHHPTGPGGPHPAAPSRRRDRKRAGGSAARSRRRNAHALPRRARRPPQPAHCRRVTFARQNAPRPRDGLQPIKQVTNPVHFTRPGARSPRPDIHANHARRTGK